MKKYDGENNTDERFYYIEDHLGSVRFDVPPKKCSKLLTQYNMENDYGKSKIYTRANNKETPRGRSLAFTRR